jgi:hypothetical protein
MEIGVGPYPDLTVRANVFCPWRGLNETEQSVSNWPTFMAWRLSGIALPFMP